MARPTSTPYAFCTTTANRIAASAAQKLLGFAGGTPVPSGVHNDLFGIVSEWVTWFSGLPVANRAPAVLVPVGLLAWRAAATTEVTDLGYGGVRVGLVGASSGRAEAVYPAEGGLLSAVSLDITVTASSATINVYLRNADGTIAARYGDSYTSADNGTISLPAIGTPAMSTGPCWVVLDVLPPQVDGESVDLEDFTLTFAAD